MNRAQITVVEDSFSIADRGTVVIGVWFDESQRLDVGDQIEVIQPDGKAFVTHLTGVDFFTKCFGNTRNIGLLFGEITDKIQLPKGTTIWLLKNN
ncbi:MAG: hypothetical protein LBE21_02730 [Pseudomonadales bacterium]|jgi:translation elongation factor EF-Tu-like GTPase|nr:hypothetical protein [Pseudomonadales bacterium]